ncbi:sulfotransferase family protein [Ilumatobacter sp.]|uniref:sulfotransferase family protein n=1 Tax=Ilumatobacter sp. TaxID=1967498 RepID=UPI003B51F0D7
MSASPSGDTPGPRGPGRCPDAIVIGATKAGTTSLFHYLSDHPQVFMDPQKELRFFSDPDRHELGDDWYRRRFADAGDRVAMESSNAYTRDPVYPHVPERMAATCPDVRLVYLVRDPMARLESHYRHRLAMGREWRTPSDAVTSDPGYVAASLYGHQLARHLEHVPIERIHVARSERLFDDSDPARAELCAFLGIDHDPARPWPRENTTRGRRVAPRLLRRAYGLRRSERIARWGRRAAGVTAARSAGDGSFELDADVGARLEERFRDDARLLAELAGDRVAVPEATTRRSRSDDPEDA